MVILQAAGGANFMFLILMLGLMAFIFWQNISRQKQERKFAESLKKGDKVVMKSGLHGRIAELTDTSIIIETMAGKLMFDRSAVSLEYTRKIQKIEEAK